MTDLVCVEVLSVPTHVAGRYTKGVATIRKLTLRMCCKNRCLNTCQAGATVVVYMLLFTSKLFVHDICTNIVSD